MRFLRAIFFKQKPMGHEEILAAYMDAAKEMKPGPQFATDFVRLVEAHHGIVPKYTVEPQAYD
jgi:hypothetical protein|tara:strand:- start:385 stop:573 length:189 start_codon:yes stop_codon:yes gene_type:complete